VKSRVARLAAVGVIVVSLVIGLGTRDGASAQAVQATCPSGPARRAQLHLVSWSNNGGASQAFTANRGDVPVTGNWEFKRQQTPAFFRQHRRGSGVGFVATWNGLGSSCGDVRRSDSVTRADTPITGDWVNQGFDGVGVFRGGRWFSCATRTRTGPADVSFAYGDPGDIPRHRRFGNGRRRRHAWRVPCRRPGT